MAIKINEFRMGNYANYSYQGTDVIFYGYNYSDGCFTDFSSIPIEPDELDAILLTEELLLRHGFVKDGPYYVNHKISITKNMIRDGSGNFNGFYCTLQCRDAFEKHYIHLMYFHQIQNLYFLLTGTELVLSGSEKIKS